MTRRTLTFPVADSRCVGTLDDAPGSCGLLIVTGGNEIRAGAWNGQALLAAAVAAAGFPVFRFDRRGVGDSEGINAGFRGAGADITAAITAFRNAAPQLRRIAALGNCDAAAALVLAGGAGCDALVLSNPWTIDDHESGGGPPPPEALRAHYARRLTDPAALVRLLQGRVSPRSLLISLRDMLRRKPQAAGLAEELKCGLRHFAGPVSILLADRDRTAQVFLARWDRRDPRLRRCPGATHSFAEPPARQWLLDQVLTTLRSLER